MKNLKDIRESQELDEKWDEKKVFKAIMDLRTAWSQIRFTADNGPYQKKLDKQMKEMYYQVVVGNFGGEHARRKGILNLLDNKPFMN